MDPNIEQEARMIIDTLTLAEENRESAIRSVVTLRSFGVESYVSLTIIDDADLFDHERADSYFAMVELIDSSGTCYRVGFSQSGFAVALYPPDGPGKSILYSQQLYSPA